MFYIGTDEGIYRWFPGAGWPTFHALQDRGIVGLASTGGGVLAVVDDAGRVLDTVNNGLDWREVAPPDGAGRPTAMAVAGAPAEILLATSRPLGLYRRPVGLADEPSRTIPGPLAFARRWAPGLLGGRRGGSTATMEPPANDLRGWSPLGTPAVEAGGAAGTPQIRALAAGPTGASWFAAVAGQGLWRSEDGGRGWARCEGLPAEVFAVRVPRQPEGLVVAGTDDGVWISQDSGRTWADSSAGLEATRRVRAVEVKPDDPKVLLAGAAPVPGASEGGPAAFRGGLTRFALFESKDAGKTWKHVPRGFPEVLEYDQIADIRFDPADTDCAVVALASGEMWATRTNGLWWEPLARQIKTARALCAVE